MTSMSVRRVVAAATLTAVVALSTPASARDLRQQPARRPARTASVLAAAFSAAGGFWSQVTAALTGDNGAGIDPNGVTTTTTTTSTDGTDSSGITTTDNGAGIDPNG